MPRATQTSRTEHLLALMTRGDDLFNARDWQALDQVHHADMIAYVTGSAAPIYGREAHGAAMQQLVRMFPDIRVHTPYPIQFGDRDWITVVTNVTGMFTGDMTLLDGTGDPTDRKGIRP
jgi:SnoaL-like polyketide cyclase